MSDVSCVPLAPEIPSGRNLYPVEVAWPPGRLGMSQVSLDEELVLTFVIFEFTLQTHGEVSGHFHGRLA